MHAAQYCGGSEAIEEGLGGLGRPVCGRFEGNMVHGVFLNLIHPTICIAPWKVFLTERPCFDYLSRDRSGGSSVIGYDLPQSVSVFVRELFRRSADQLVVA